MKIETKPLRYAHAEGHTAVCYTEDGQNIITCGHDGDVRIWVDIEDDDPNSHCVGESALAVCYKDKRLYVATDNHAVQAYTFPAFDKDGIVTRFTAPVTQIMTSKKIEVLGCSSENMEAKICSPEGGAPLFVMSEQKGPVLSIAICPHMKYASTASGDGVLRIFDIDTQNKVKEINCVPKINTFYAAKVLCRMDFEPSEGKYLAYPNNREIILVDCESWAQRMTFTHSSIKCAISQCLFSPCGKFLAGSTIAGQIAVWDVDTGACIDIVEHPTSHNVTSMAWNPKGNGVLSYCDVAGQLGTLLNCYGQPSDSDANVEEADVAEDADMNDLDNLIENYASDDNDDDGAISIEKLKNGSMGIAGEAGSPAESRAATPGPSYAGCPPQPPLQPGATPVHLEHRYMCWNEVGIVRCHSTEAGESNIEVEFHDAATHHGLHLNNYLRHTVASLSDTVLAMACETPSKLVCISLVGSSKEWSESLPDTEEALCVAAGSDIVALATDARLLRLYTAMGTQRQVISLCGPVVCVSARGSAVFCVSHSAPPSTDQHLNMDIIASNGRQLRSKTVPVPLTPGSKLTWAGWSDAGAPCVADSSGRVNLYDMSAGVWLPICNTSDHSKGASDSWYIVSVSESSQTVRCILCRGASFPPTVPKPIVTELPMQLPLCSPESEKSRLEEQLARWPHSAADVSVQRARQTALTLFALACRSEIEQRALELMELLRDDRLLPLAAKYASRLGKIHLAEKLQNLSDTWENETERLNVAQNPHFQQLESQVVDVTQTEDMNASLIIPQKSKEKKEVETPIKPVPIKSSPGGARNPFRKQQEAGKSAQSPLTLTDRALVQHTNGHDDTAENNDPLKPNAGETFVDWFSRNKSTLEAQHTDLTPSELTRSAVRTFKNLQSSSQTPDNSNKRKLEELDAQTTPTNTPKQSKLSSFAFQKKSDS